MLFCLSDANITHFRKKNKLNNHKLNITNKTKDDFAKFTILANQE